MPNYEYRCKCGYEFEMKQGYEADLLMSCPDCGAQAVRRLSLCNNSFGWTLSEASYIKGNPQELVRNI